MAEIEILDEEMAEHLDNFPPEYLAEAKELTALAWSIYERFLDEPEFLRPEKVQTIFHLTEVSLDILRRFEKVCKANYMGSPLKMIGDPESYFDLPEGFTDETFDDGSGSYMCVSYRPGSVMWGIGCSAASALMPLYSSDPAAESWKRS